MRLAFSFVLLLFFPSAWAQKMNVQHTDERTLQQFQDSLKKLEPLVFESKTDEQRYEANKKFSALLEQVLGYQESFSFPFDSLKGIARLTSADKTFRIYNWNVPRNDGTFEYFGFIQSYSKKDKAYRTFALTDRSDEIKNADNSVGTADKWYGMLYYKIIENKYKKHTYYTLLGWDGNDNLSRKKIIDVVTFGPDGTPKFGDAIFTYEKKFPRRVMFEFGADVVMALSYNEATKKYEDGKEVTKDMIVFSHLVPSHPALEGQYQFYVTDGSYDAFMFKKGKWEYVADVDVRNEKSRNDNMEGKSVQQKKMFTPGNKKRGK